MEMVPYMPTTTSPVNALSRIVECYNCGHDSGYRALNIFSLITDTVVGSLFIKNEGQVVTKG